MNYTQLYTCDNGHDAIATNNMQCPLCEALKQIETLESELEDKDIEIKDLQGDIRRLENELNTK